MRVFLGALAIASNCGLEDFDSCELKAWSTNPAGDFPTEHQSDGIGSHK
jgi:hypothetical protein